MNNFVPSQILGEMGQNIIVQHSPTGILTFDQQGLIHSCNPKAAQLFGYYPEALIGRSLYSFVSAFPKAGRMSVVGYDQNQNPIPLLLDVNPIEIGEKCYYVGHIQSQDSSSYSSLPNIDEPFLYSFFPSCLAHSSDPIIILNPDQTIRIVNEAFEKTYGWSKHEVLSQSIPFIPDQHLEEFQSILQAVSEGKSISGYEMACLHKEGRVFDSSITLFPIRDHRDCIISYLFVSRDISERTKYLEELRMTNEHLLSFFTNTSDAIGIFDLNGRHVSINPASSEIFGYSAEEVLGKEVQTLPSSKYLDEVSVLHQRVRSGESIKGFETIRKRKDGSLVDVSISYSPIRNKDGKVIAFANILRDITESKRVEKALRESEIKYRLIAENMSDLIRIIDVEGKVLYASPSHQNVLGTTTDQVEGTSTFQDVHLEDVERVKQAFQEMITTKQPGTVDLRYLHQDGHWLVLESRCKPVLDLSGNVERMICVARDITERKQTEELLRNSDKLSIIGQLAAGIAHEIRNPLTSLRGFLQLLQEQYESFAYYNVMISELDRINFIASEFLLLAKPQSMNYKETNITSLLNDVIRLLDAQAILNNVQILTAYSNENWMITCEENQLKQVFINVLKNSIEAMPTGGTILVQMTEPFANVLSLRFVDEGCGISPERIPLLGEPFYTTKEKGTGLGLMVSYKIIRDHQGTITVTSELNKGTIVEIRLPH